jgi:Ca2+-binding EF-hand superfamily protein
MSNRVFESRVIDAPLHIVWKAVSPVDFKFIPTLATSEIEGNDSPFRVGSIRRVTFSNCPNAMQRYRLVQLSEVDFSVTFEMVESVPPVSYSAAMHTFKLRKVTTNNSSFVEMESEFSRDAPTKVLEEVRQLNIRTLYALQQFCTKDTKPKGKRVKARQEEAKMPTATTTSEQQHQTQPTIARAKTVPRSNAGTVVADTAPATASATACATVSASSEVGTDVLPTIDQLRKTTEKDLEAEWKQFDVDHSGALEPQDILRVVEGLIARIAEEDSDVVTFTLNMFNKPEAPGSQISPITPTTSAQSLTTEFKTDLRKKQRILAQELLGKMDRNHDGKVELCEFQTLFNEWLQKKLSTLIAGAYYGFGRDGHMPLPHPPV